MPAYPVMGSVHWALRKQFRSKSPERLLIWAGGKKPNGIVAAGVRRVYFIYLLGTLSRSFLYNIVSRYPWFGLYISEDLTRS